MRYPENRYVRSHGDGANEITLLSFDGTSRRVTFDDPKAVCAATREGRADLDAAAIAQGFLPLGATHVTAAVPRSGIELAKETFEIANPSSYDPEDRRRMDRSVALHAKATRPVTKASDGSARAADPNGAARYTKAAMDLGQA